MFCFRTASLGGGRITKVVYYGISDRQSCVSLHVYGLSLVEVHLRLCYAKLGLVK